MRRTLLSIILFLSLTISATAETGFQAITLHFGENWTGNAYRPPYVDATGSEGVPIDAMYTSLFRELLTYMMEDPRNITFCTHLLFCAKNLERIGDHAMNIGEYVIYWVMGKDIRHTSIEDVEKGGLI